MVSASNSIGITLRERRKGLRLSQAQVGRLTGKTQSQIARLEQGLGDPRISSIIQVSRSLGTELIPVPIRLLPAVKQFLAELEPGTQSDRTAKLVGNDPEDFEEGSVDV
jgi:transcriptional regulator with XRE-family HTH domain